MLRLIHAQTVVGAILVPDIDDGLPNKTAHRLEGDPKQYERDGYANSPKQKCYIPPTGYIDLQETDRVVASAAKGAIKKLQNAGLISVVSFTPADLNTPVLTLANLDAPGAGDLTLTGTGFLSLAPATSSVVITGTGAITLTSTQITTGGGTFTNTSVVIPTALIPGVVVTASSAKVIADGLSSAVVALT
jgi:hypothetical protein